MAPKTIHSIHEMLHKALSDAERKGSVVRNVAALADPPKLSSTAKPPMRVWDAEQLRQFLDGIDQHRLHPAYYLAAACAEARSSACAGKTSTSTPAASRYTKHLRRLRPPDRRRQDRHQPSDDRPRPPNHHRPPIVEVTPTRGTPRPRRRAPRPRARVRPPRRNPDPPRPVLQNLRPPRRPLWLARHPPPRPPPQPRQPATSERCCARCIIRHGL